MIFSRLSINFIPLRYLRRIPWEGVCFPPLTYNLPTGGLESLDDDNINFWLLHFCPPHLMLKKEPKDDEEKNEKEPKYQR